MLFLTIIENNLCYVESILTLGKILPVFHWKVYFGAIACNHHCGRQIISLLQDSHVGWSAIQFLVEQQDHHFDFSDYLTKIPKLANMIAYQTTVEI